MENLRKRANREKIDSIKYGSSNLARDILSPSDNLARALDNLPEEADRTQLINNFIDGLKMIQKELTFNFRKTWCKKNRSNYTINLITIIIKLFLKLRLKNMKRGGVVQEIQSGYTMHERLLRPTMVGVSKKPAKDKKGLICSNIHVSRMVVKLS